MFSDHLVFDNQLDKTVTTCNQDFASFFEETRKFLFIKYVTLKCFTTVLKSLDQTKYVCGSVGSFRKPDTSVLLSEIRWPRKT